MTIGLDLSSLQGPHRMRGIGYTLINFINNIPPEQRQKHDFVFYYYTDEGHDDPLELLDLKDLKYTVRSLEQPKENPRELPGRLSMLSRIFKKLSSLGAVYRGDPRIQDTNGIDVFLQTDQMVTPPRGWGLKKAMIAYDVIPYVLEADYLWGYKTARANGRSRLSAFKHAVSRKSYMHKLRVNARRCDKVIAISETTRKDFMKYARVSGSKITAVPLGVNVPGASSADSQPGMHHYVDSSWGYLKRPYKMDDTPFLLFVGGADHRRRLDDLVTSFNHLRAQGHDLKLVLAGDIMRGPESIPIERTRTALETSSYADDIIFMGFVDDEQRDWLYNNALAYVFPSLYEGFGLPVLEAMSHGCPVISYRNEATVEVAGKTPMYADSAAGVTAHVLEILGFSDAKVKSLRAAGKTHAKKYTWSDTVTKIFDIIGA